MTVRDLLAIKELKVAVEGDMDLPVSCGYMGDLLSVVMGYAEEESAWITIQSHVNIVAVATLRGVSAIIIAHGFEPDEDTVETAKEENITILTTELNPFEAAKKLVEFGL